MPHLSQRCSLQSLGYPHSGQWFNDVPISGNV
jgi:hypothetical protein